jgi:hypothetical protein
MSRLRLGVSVGFVLLLVSGLLSATAGSFRGVIVRGPDNRPGWIWVAGAHGSLRQVEVSRASVVYDDAVPAAQRDRVPAKSIKTGVEVRVTADQDGNGEWRASRIEILKIGTAGGQTRRTRHGIASLFTPGHIA